MAPPKVKETYLGDGLYVSHDGYQFRLRAPRGEGDHMVFMDYQTFLNFLKYANAKHGMPTEEKKDGDEAG